MIYTLTLNPALDHALTVGTVTEGHTNRAREESLRIGGKGINVSRVLRVLGLSSVALAVVAGDTGRLLSKAIAREGLTCELFATEGMTRINTKLRYEDGSITEINAPGPHVDEGCIEALRERLSRLTEQDLLVLAGNPPADAPSDVYPRLIAALPRGVRFWADTTGAHLKAVVPLHPYAVKPNIDELEEYIGRRLTTECEITEAALTLQRDGATCVMVTLGDKGLLYVTAEGVCHRLPSHPIRPVNTVGAGDATLAGLLAGLAQTSRAEEAARMANAVGAATAATEDLPTRDAVLSLLAAV